MQLKNFFVSRFSIDCEVHCNLGGSIDSLHNAVAVIELAIEKGAETVLMPVLARKQLFELSDDMATKVNIQFYSEAQDAIFKALVD